MKASKVMFSTNLSEAARLRNQYECLALGEATKMYETPKTELETCAVLRMSLGWFIYTPKRLV